MSGLQQKGRNKEKYSEKKGKGQPIELYYSEYYKRTFDNQIDYLQSNNKRNETEFGCLV